jgi:hypothetical protein
MDTLAERMRELQDAGWAEQLAVADGGLRCGGCSRWAAPQEIVMNEFYRFEGASDPDDESILLAVSMPCGHRGALPASYGPNTPPDVAEFVTRLRLGRG